jgi:polysaccharide export outer membrane protein
VKGWIAAVVLTATGLAAAEPVSVSAQWQTVPGLDGQALLLRFERAPKGIETHATPAGLEVVLEDASMTGELPEGVKATRNGTTTSLRLDRPKIFFRSMRVDATSVTILVSGGASGSVAGAYTVGVGDIILVSVYKNPDLTGEYAVTPDGSIALPLVGIVSVAGRGEAEIAADLTRRLAADFLVDPQVSVQVKTYQSQYVYVTGAVQRSGRVAIRPGITLRGALSEAGAVLTPDMSIELRHANGETSILGAASLDAANAPVPVDGDVLDVKQQNFVSIYGEVRHPNRLALTPGLTLLQSIAMAEGLTEWANKKKIQILRKTPSGTQQITINLNDVESRKVSDPPLKPEDVIMVGRRIL